MLLAGLIVPNLPRVREPTKDGPYTSLVLQVGGWAWGQSPHTVRKNRWLQKACSLLNRLYHGRHFTDDSSWTRGLYLLKANLVYATERKIITIQGFGNKRTCSYFSTGQGLPLKMLIYPAPLQYSITMDTIVWACSVCWKGCLTRKSTNFPTKERGHVFQQNKVCLWKCLCFNRSSEHVPLFPPVGKLH